MSDYRDFLQQVCRSQLRLGQKHAVTRAHNQHNTLRLPPLDVKFARTTTLLSPLRMASHLCPTYKLSFGYPLSADKLVARASSTREQLMYCARLTKSYLVKIPAPGMPGPHTAGRRVLENPLDPKCMLHKSVKRFYCACGRRL